MWNFVNFGNFHGDNYGGGKALFSLEDPLPGTIINFDDTYAL
jgi:hypothetical protein